jgi:DNA-binding IclR family transcriptional regulator
VTCDAYDEEVPTDVPIDDRQGIQSVEIAMTVLDAVEAGGAPVSLTQIAKASEMTPSKVHRYLVSLTRAGLVAQSRDSGLYDLGPALRRLGMEALRRTDEVGLVSDGLPGLRDRTSHAVNLAIWSDHGPVNVRWQYGSYALPITIRIGAIMPLATTSVGRVFLAHLPDTLTEPVLRADTDNALGTTELKRIKDEVLRTGYATTTNAMIPGITSVAAPVVADTMPTPLAVGVALPARSTSAEVTAVAEELVRTTTAMSVELGAAVRPATAKRPGRPSRIA